MKAALAGARLDAALGHLARPLREFATTHPGLALAGGAVRDVLLGRPIHDADIAVTRGHAIRIGKAFADRAGGALVILGQQRLIRVQLKDATVDFTPLRAKDLDADLRARDFTVNAMAIPLPWDDPVEVVDPLGGRADLAARRLRACSGHSFRDDPIRLWRAHRQAVQLGLAMDPATRKLVQRDARLVAKAGGERLRDELFKLLGAPGAARGLAAARASGVLLASLPELKPMQAVKLKGRTPIDVLAHTLDAIAQLEPVIRGLPKAAPLDHAEIAAHLAMEPVPGRSRRALLGLAVLLHDIAKPETASVNPAGDVHFFQHESIGARAAAVLLRKRLKFAEPEVAAVTRLIALHLRPGYLAAQREASDKAAYRLIRDAGEEVLELLLHAQADRLATRHGLRITARRHRAMVDRILGLRRAMRDRQPAVRYLDGHAVMKAFKMKPGPAVGEALRAVDEAVALGRVRTRAEALAVARKALDRPGTRML